MFFHQIMGLLFKLFINDLCYLNNSMEDVLFADDSTVYCQSDPILSTEAFLSEDLDKICLIKLLPKMTKKKDFLSFELRRFKLRRYEVRNPYQVPGQLVGLNCQLFNIHFQEMRRNF